MEWSAKHDSIGTTRSEREEEEPGGYSLGLGEGRGFVGLRGPRRVVIGRALVLGPHLHDGLLGLIFSAGGPRQKRARFETFPKVGDRDLGR